MLLTLFGIAGVVGLYRFDRRRRLTRPSTDEDTKVSEVPTKDQAELWERFDQLGGRERGNDSGSEPEVDVEIGQPMPAEAATGTDPEAFTDEHCGDEGRSDLELLENENENENETDGDEGDDSQSGSTGTEDINIR